MKKYNAWKSDSKFLPIEGSDRVFTANTKREVIKHLAFEEGVKYKQNDTIVRCKDGSIWCVSLGF